MALSYGPYFESILDCVTQEGEGVRLSGVRPGSLAEKAGLHEGDLIVKMAGVRIKNLHDLVYVLQSKRVILLRTRFLLRFVGSLS